MLIRRTKQAFTLAEVLLTLAIIGVVAALTIPAVITKVTKDQYVTGLKKAYNTVKTVERAVVQEHGPIENWDVTGATKDNFEKYFKEHFDIIKICEDTEKGCWPEASERSLLNGDKWPADFNTSAYYRFITSDGMAWAYYGTGFDVDVNGLKGPNRVGRDIFYFYAHGNPLSFKPNGWYWSSVDINANCNTSTGDGWICGAKVLTEGKMDY